MRLYHLIFTLWVFIQAPARATILIAAHARDSFVVGTNDPRSRSESVCKVHIASNLVVLRGSSLVAFELWPSDFDLDHDLDAALSGSNLSGLELKRLVIKSTEDSLYRAMRKISARDRVAQYRRLKNFFIIVGYDKQGPYFSAFTLGVDPRQAWHPLPHMGYVVEDVSNELPNGSLFNFTAQHRDEVSAAWILSSHEQNVGSNLEAIMDDIHRQIAGSADPDAAAAFGPPYEVLSISSKGLRFLSEGPACKQALGHR